MSCWSREIWIEVEALNLILQIALLVAPLLTTLWSRHVVLKANEQDRPSRWLQSRRQARVIRLAVLALWWALWDSRQPGFGSPRDVLLFWIPTVACIAAAQTVACWTSKAVFRLKWGSTRLLRLALWSTVSPAIPLLFVACGFESIYAGQLRGLLWLVVAGFVAIVGASRLRSAEGIALRKLKLGKFHGRAFRLARRMKVNLKTVYVVPAGKGHLTNAYGLGRSIAITDNYGEWLDGGQLDFVICHELTHVKQQHGRKQVLIVLVLFFVLAVASFWVQPIASRFLVVMDVFAILGPALAYYFISRHFEYAADRGAVDATSDPETAIVALRNMYAMNNTTSCGRFLEFFQTHPTMERRVTAIARITKIPAARVTKILGLVGENVVLEQGNLD